MICPFFSRNFNKNLIFRDENGNFFSASRVSRREQEFFYFNLVFREGDENLKIISQGRARKINLILTRIPEIENSRYALLHYLVLCLAFVSKQATKVTCMTQNIGQKIDLKVKW